MHPSVSPGPSPCSSTCSPATSATASSRYLPRGHEIFGIEWNDDFADESFTVYDHPKTLVFRRVSEISAPELLERIAAPRPGVSREDMIGASIGEPTEAALPGETGGSLAALARWLALLVLLTFAGSRLAATTLPDLPPSVAAGLGPVTGVLTLSWAVWLAVAAGGAPFGPALAMTGVTLLVLVSLCLPGRPERLGKSALVFLGTFALFALARSIHPEIFWGEKPMDFSFLNAPVPNDDPTPPRAVDVGQVDQLLLLRTLHGRAPRTVLGCHARHCVQSRHRDRCRARRHHLLRDRAPPQWNFPVEASPPPPS